MEVWNIIIAVLVGACIGAGLVLWWVARSTSVTADREINGWPAWHIGYMSESGTVYRHVRIYAVRESVVHWHLWRIVNDSTPSRITYRPHASRAELLEVAFNPGASNRRGAVVVPKED